MSKVLGIIAEYNPFHNGHLYHLNESKKITNTDYTIAIISGNFTQRGSTSIVDKWKKTEMALQNGIDLIIELPLLYSISSGENFAEGAIKILNSLGIVDYLSFGSETPDINILDSIASYLYEEPKEYKNLLSNQLATGISFPKARENALLEYIEKNKSIKINLEKYKKVMSSPNNILGIEYLKALKKYKSPIQPVCINRFAADYNSIEFTSNNNINSNYTVKNLNYQNIASATAIRKFLKDKDYKTIKKLVPYNTYSILDDCIKNGCIVPDLNIFEREIIYTLRRMSTKEIANLPDVSEGLEFLIKKAANSCNTISGLLNAIKSKRYTITRLQRILLYALLNISKEDMTISKNIDLPYVRILGFNANGKKLISEIMTKKQNLPLITSVKKFTEINSNNDLKLLLSKDIFATDIYSLGFENNSFANLDFKKGIVKI